MNIFVNDKEKEIDSNLSVADYLEHSGITASKSIVTLNGKTLTIEELPESILKENDKLELFSFVGGG